MAEFEQNEFKFPDEESKETQGELEIEIEDDTPEEDRGREPMPSEIVEELDKDELDQYSDDVKQRMKQLKKVWHDERRAKETAYREQQQAIEAAKRLLDENRRYKEMISSGQTEYVSAVKKTSEMQLDAAKRAYKEAYESGDPDQILDAQERITKATMDLERINNFRPAPLQQENNVVQTQQAPKPDPKAVAWQERNPWFGQDEEMTAAALGLHEKLKRNGVVVGSDEYYSTLDKTMRKRFSENFNETDETPRQRVATVVAPAKRTTSPKKVRLTKSQMATIKKLGITPEQYVKEVLKLES
jgi:7-cyano-7-deazaguanine synthase in queuosine biosynthesis